MSEATWRNRIVEKFDGFYIAKKVRPIQADVEPVASGFHGDNSPSQHDWYVLGIKMELADLESSLGDSEYVEVMPPLMVQPGWLFSTDAIKKYAHTGITQTDLQQWCSDEHIECYQRENSLLVNEKSLRAYLVRSSCL